METNYLKKYLNFIFPKNKIQKEKIKLLLKNKIIYFHKKNIIIFLPYKNNLVKKNIWDLKFNKKFKISNLFGEIIYENLPDILEDLKIQKNFNNPLLISIPISFTRKVFRGYDQNNLIIKSFIKYGGGNFIEWEKNNLKKIKNTKPQFKIKNKEKRIENIKNSLKIKKPEKIIGRNILLFDDILTTGATLNEAKKALKKAGAKKIIFMVMAH